MKLVILGSTGSIGTQALEVVEELKGIKDIEVEHVSLGELSAQKFDLLVVARDIVYQCRQYPRIVELFKIMDMKELTEKMDKALAETEDEFHIR